MKRLHYILIFCFTATVLFFGCAKEMSNENGNLNNLLATGSLKDSSGNCFPDSVVGTFYNGIIPGADTAFVILMVDVKTTGTYSIRTDMQNGFLFSDSGYFNTTGITTIVLRPSGKPILPIVTDFTVSFDSSICQFSINVKDSTGTGLGGIDTTNLSDTAWQFSNGTVIFNGPIDTAKIIDSSGSKLLKIIGSTSATGDSLFAVHILLKANIITAGDVYSSVDSANFAFVDSLGSNIYFSNQTIPTFVLTITIDSFDSVNNIVSVSFNGSAKDALGNPVTIVSGKFKAKIT